MAMEITRATGVKPINRLSLHNILENIYAKKICFSILQNKINEFNTIKIQCYV